MWWTSSYKQLYGFVNKRTRTTWGHSWKFAQWPRSHKPCDTRGSWKPQHFVPDGRLEKPFLKRTTILLRWQFKQIGCKQIGCWMACSSSRYLQGVPWCFLVLYISTSFFVLQGIVVHPTRWTPKNQLFQKGEITPLMSRWNFNSGKPIGAPHEFLNKPGIVLPWVDAVWSVASHVRKCTEYPER